MKVINYNIGSYKEFYNIFDNVILKNYFVGVQGFYNKKLIYINLREPTKKRDVFLLVLNVKLDFNGYIYFLGKIKEIDVNEQIKINQA